MVATIKEYGATVIHFTKDVTVNKILMKPFVGVYLKKQQARYVADLRRALGDNYAN